MLTGQQKIADLAAKARDMSFTSLNSYLTLDWMREAFRRTRKDGAVGVDGVTAETYAQYLEANLQDLLERCKSGNYVAPALRRHYIPKAGSKGAMRPIAIPCFEDKILQRAVHMVLEPIYEQDFKDCSYGFRPARSAHQCVAAIRETLMHTKGGIIIDVDLRQYFDSIPHDSLREILRGRVHDGVILRTIDKWLNAGILEHGQYSYAERGVPQGGNLSPLLSNIVLHEVMDKWIEEVIKRKSSVRHRDEVECVN